MKNNFAKEIIVAVILVILSIILLDPFNFLMPPMLLISVLVGVLVIFGVFASFILRENPEDERDNLHRIISARVAFLSGTAILTAGIIFGALKHSLDPWLVFTLTVMIIAKIATRIYLNSRF